ncbi:host attachment family protein [Peteryoungia ipomoeae]|uniref:Host cell attachment protein n=1 Tax=Peteryoungia ipomoeae TaxID=1210932 RepID=A0A4S8NZG9_9HYPH|nr:host attachment protein [Peteryoungia ipomoeae]THV23008.1 host cell attachment protein [Peteryoungia ipomoeae]
MNLPQNTIVAVADGEKLALFQNEGQGLNIKLKALPVDDVDASKHPSGSRHPSSAANPSDDLQEEDAFGSGVTDMLNRQVLDGKIENLVIIAAPRTLGEMRKAYHKALSAVLVKELDKDLTGHSIPEIEKALEAA